MRRMLPLLAVSGIVLALFVFRPDAPAPGGTPNEDASSPTTIPEYEWYPVVRVVDGDTIIMNIAGAETRVRLIGVDTPETVDTRAPVECFGAEASEKTKQILSGSSARLETDPSQGMYDKYGRLLAYVYAPANSRPEGILVNEYLITEGYGHEYTYDLPYKYQTEFKAAERSARENKKGSWADGACAQ